MIDHLSVTGACEENLRLDLFSVNYSIGSHFKDAKLPRQEFCWVVYLRNRGIARTSRSWGRKCFRAEQHVGSLLIVNEDHETWTSCEWLAQGNFLRVFSVLCKPKQICIQTETTEIANLVEAAMTVPDLASCCAIDMNQEPPGHSRYEILKIWIPTHGVVNVYRNPRGEYHADNAFVLEKPINRYGVEKLRILASQGGVIKITRDQSVPPLQNNLIKMP
ncbi:hypothetical protein ACROYT_G029811 [Oculina patagonica]